jgi:hypothetical protein
MKGYALGQRLKHRDAYDIYHCIRNYPGGIEGLAEACHPLLESKSAMRGYRSIADKFEAVDGLSPTHVRKFVQESEVPKDRTADQWRQDAFGQVDAWLRALGLRS